MGRSKYEDLPQLVLAQGVEAQTVVVTAGVVEGAGAAWLWLQCRSSSGHEHDGIGSVAVEGVAVGTEQVWDQG